MTENRSSTSAAHGSAEQRSTEHLRGSVKEALGKLTGDTGIEAEGRRQKRQAKAPDAKHPIGTKPTRSDRD